jgi:glycosyltransferase EpsD
LKILFVTTISNTVNAFLIPYIKLLVENGHQVDVAFNVVQDVSSELINLGCKIHYIGFQRTPLKTSNYTAYKQIKNIILDEGYELVHTHTPIASFLTRLACRKNSKSKILYTAHGLHYYKGAPLLSWLIYYPIEKLTAKFTDGIITINEEDYVSVRNMKCNKTDSIYKVNGIGIDLNKFYPQTAIEKYAFREQYGYKKNDFILMYTAELNHNKHQDLLINAVNLLKHNIPNIKLLLAGEGPLLNKYQDHVNKLGLSDSIDFLGYRSDIPNLLKLSDVAVSASRREGLPVNIMEAMATGLPLVVSNCRGNRDLVINGQNGYVVGIDDTKSFAESIEKLYNSEELRREFGNRGIHLVNRYSLENVIIEMKTIYAKMIMI